MITRKQAMSENVFHSDGCETGLVLVYTRTGPTINFKARKKDFWIPVITDTGGRLELNRYDARLLHLPEDCPNK